MSDIPPMDEIEFEYMVGYLLARYDFDGKKGSDDAKDAMAAVMTAGCERYKNVESRRIFLFRWMALLRLMWDGHLSDAYYLPGDNSKATFLDGRAIRLAARFPVKDDWKFDSNKFLELLRQETE